MVFKHLKKAWDTARQHINRRHPLGKVVKQRAPQPGEFRHEFKRIIKRLVHARLLHAGQRFKRNWKRNTGIAAVCLGMLAGGSMAKNARENSAQRAEFAKRYAQIGAMHTNEAARLTVKFGKGQILSAKSVAAFGEMATLMAGEKEQLKYRHFAEALKIFKEGYRSYKSDPERFIQAEERDSAAVDPSEPIDHEKRLAVFTRFRTLPQEVQTNIAAFCGFK